MVKEWVLGSKGIQGIEGARSNLEESNIQLGASKVLGEVVYPKVQVKVNKRMIEEPKCGIRAYISTTDNFGSQLFA